MSCPDAYDRYVAEWKRRQGLPDHSAAAPDDEQVMAGEDAKAKGKDYCMGCGEQFLIREMRIVTDPHMQFDERPERKDNYIPRKYRVRMCAPCFKEDYESFDEEPPAMTSPTV